MVDSEIGDLTEQTSLDDSTDVFPIQDISADTTDKVTIATLSTGFAFSAIKTISSGNITPDQKHIVVAAETGTADDLDGMNALANFNEVYLYADTGDTITLRHNQSVTGKIITPQGYSLTLHETKPTILIKVGGEWKVIYTPNEYVEIPVAISDETTAITTGTAKVTFRIFRAFRPSKVKASLSTASSSGNPAFDVNDDGASIFSTTLTIDANEKTSETAATAAVISSTGIAADSEITVDIDTAGTGAKGAKIYLIGYYTS